MIDDYNWRTHPCKSVILSEYKIGTEKIPLTRKCYGTHQFKRKGTSIWMCTLCNKPQYVGETTNGKEPEAPARRARRGA